MRQLLLKGCALSVCYFLTSFASHFAVAFSPLGVGLKPDSRRLWPDAVVPYDVHEDLNNPSRVKLAVRDWNATMPIKFIKRDKEDDYVRFVSSAKGITGSEVGRAGGRQYITLADWAGKSSILHEMGHAVGLLHEHQRSDADDHLDYEPDAIDWSREQQQKRGISLSRFRKLNFDRIPDNSREYQDYGEFDINSIMLYGSYSGSKLSEPVYRKKQSGRRRSKTFSQPNSLSAGDVATVKAMYEKVLERTTKKNEAKPLDPQTPDEVEARLKKIEKELEEIKRRLKKLEASGNGIEEYTEIPYGHLHRATLKEAVKAFTSHIEKTFKKNFDGKKFVTRRALSNRIGSTLERASLLDFFDEHFYDVRKVTLKEFQSGLKGWAEDYYGQCEASDGYVYFPEEEVSTRLRDCTLSNKGLRFGLQLARLRNSVMRVDSTRMADIDSLQIEPVITQWMAILNTFRNDSQEMSRVVLFPYRVGDWFKPTDLLAIFQSEKFNKRALIIRSGDNALEKARAALPLKQQGEKLWTEFVEDLTEDSEDEVYLITQGPKEKLKHYLFVLDGDILFGFKW